MAVTVVRPADRQLTPVDPASTKAPVAVLQQSQRQILSGDSPYVQLVELAPGSTVPAHSHSTSEVTVVLSGRVRVGDTDCEAGTIFLIPADERYALEVLGDEPLTFVVVRPGAAEYAAS
jgi:quercetin dioxygenase-like cupin family protein